jgi:hypothetical protein
VGDLYLLGREPRSPNVHPHTPKNFAQNFCTPLVYAFRARTVRLGPIRLGEEFSEKKIQRQAGTSKNSAAENGRDRPPGTAVIRILPLAPALRAQGLPETIGLLGRPNGRPTPDPLPGRPETGISHAHSNIHGLPLGLPTPGQILGCQPR